MSLRFNPVVLALAVALPLAACTTYRVDQRIAYWRAETAAHLPSGTKKLEAETFFAARGVALNCCVSELSYDVVVLVEFSPEQAVAGVRVARWGVGL